MDSQEHEELIADYAQRCAEDADTSTLMDIFIDSIRERLSPESAHDTVMEIAEHYPEILADISHGKSCAYRNKGECDCYKSKIIMTSEKYVANSGIICPVCHSDQVNGSSLEVDAGGSYQPCECESCGSTWTDTYELKGYENLDAKYKEEKTIH
jgi:hypothetical protein